MPMATRRKRSKSVSRSLLLKPALNPVTNKLRRVAPRNRIDFRSKGTRTLAEQYKQVRSYFGLTQKELANILGKDSLTVSRVECGKLPGDRFRIEQLLELARLFGEVYNPADAPGWFKTPLPRCGDQSPLDLTRTAAGMLALHDMLKTPSGAGKQLGQAPNKQIAIGLLDEWLADESGYDEATWPVLRESIEQSRTSYRRRFADETRHS